MAAEQDKGTKAVQMDSPMRVLLLGDDAADAGIRSRPGIHQGGDPQQGDTFTGILRIPDTCSGICQGSHGDVPRMGSGCLLDRL